MNKKIILGCGTGRCGSVSLAVLLNNCIGTEVMHYCPIEEAFTMNTNTPNSKYIVHIAPMGLTRFINLLIEGVDCKCICLERGMEETVGSFLKNSKKKTREQLENMWYHYYTVSHLVEKNYPDKFKIITPEKMNSKEGQDIIFDFVDIEKEDRRHLKECWFNKSE